MSTTATVEDVEQTILASFRRKPDGKPVEIRITASVGRKFKVIQFRKWIRMGVNRDGEVWIPTKEGCALGPGEIDAAISALVRAKSILEGPATRPTPAPLPDRDGYDPNVKPPWEG